MSQNYGETPSSGTTETAKHEASEVKDAAQAEAGNVVQTAKSEAHNVASEAKSQAKQVYGQTKRELTEQAAHQQQRVAEGLRSIGDELDSLAQGSENPGLATDLVRQASSRVAGASDWLAQRDPGSLVDEVKSFARRKPGVFIAGALIAGLVAGRLTRALTESAKEEHDASAPTGTTGAAPIPGVSAPAPAPYGSTSTPVGGPTGVPAAPSAPTHAPVGSTGLADDATPLYDRSRSGLTSEEPSTEGVGETRDDR